MTLFALCIHTGAALLAPTGPTGHPWSSETGRIHYVTADGRTRYVHADIEGVLPADAEYPVMVRVARARNAAAISIRAFARRTNCRGL